ncbi:MAG: helix-turn-helix domain-containing protein, partial [Erysipelotrichaceae bacterium]|nr:helix-turn-helix domain-containing protein [Erysipelotrichaceae bacterium]
MLKVKMDALYKLLGCNNADIARVLGCSPSTISKLRTSNKEYLPSSKTIQNFAEGIYRFAEIRDGLDELGELCEAEDTVKEVLVPTLITWLFTDDSTIKNVTQLPKLKKLKHKEEEIKSFGKKLDVIMELLEISNVRMAKRINVDPSTVSRFRNGFRLPKSPIKELLVTALLERAESINKQNELSDICNIPVGVLLGSNDALSTWLYSTEDLFNRIQIDNLLDTIEQFQNSNSSHLPEVSLIVPDEIRNSDKTIYWGLEGYREAVLRFLGNAAVYGGELWLYSDRAEDWMMQDTDFYKSWTALMFLCVSKGVKIKIINNTEGNVAEMMQAISTWLPLYMSGKIEPYVCHLGKDTRFSRTIFLRVGEECISACVFRGNEDNEYCEYLTDEKRLDAIASDYKALLEKSSPLFKANVGDNSAFAPVTEVDDELLAILPNLSVVTMSDTLIDSILKHNHVSEEIALEIKREVISHRAIFESFIEEGVINELITLPNKELFLSKTGENELI